MKWIILCLMTTMLTIGCGESEKSGDFIKGTLKVGMIMGNADFDKGVQNMESHFSLETITDTFSLQASRDAEIEGINDAKYLGYMGGRTCLARGEIRNDTLLLSHLIVIDPEENPDKILEFVGDTITQFHRAAFECDSQRVATAISSGIDINCTNRAGVTPLAIASLRGCNNLIGVLIADGADVNFEDARHATPLIYAAESCDTSAVRLLLNHGANLHSMTFLGYSALYHAISQDCDDVAKMLIEEGLRPNSKRPDGNTELHIAAINCNDGLITQLIDAGADINAQNADSETPLHFSAKKGCAKEVALLLSLGADTTLKSQSGLTAKEVATGDAKKAFD